MKFIKKTICFVLVVISLPFTLPSLGFIWLVITIDEWGN